MSDSDYNLSLEDQVEDVKALVHSLFGDDKTPIFIVGHRYNFSVKSTFLNVFSVIK